MSRAINGVTIIDDEGTFDETAWIASVLSAFRLLSDDKENRNEL